MNNVQNFLKNAKIAGKWGSIRGVVLIREPLVCKDGFSISVQASSCHYCSPRENLVDCNYDFVELGYPTEKEEMIASWAEDKSNLCETVYGNVPVEVVEKLIQKHNGIDYQNSFSKEALKEMRDKKNPYLWKEDEESAEDAIARVIKAAEEKFSEKLWMYEKTSVRGLERVWHAADADVVKIDTESALDLFNAMCDIEAIPRVDDKYKGEWLVWDSIVSNWKVWR